MDPIRYISGLIVVGLLLGLMAWLLRKLRKGGYGTGRHLEVLSVVGLGPREKLVVIRFRQRELLLGVTAHSISRLACDETKISSALVPVPEEGKNEH
jgi:flagellar protein FliO/FliZ